MEQTDVKVSFYLKRSEMIAEEIRKQLLGMASGQVGQQVKVWRFPENVFRWGW